MSPVSTATWLARPVSRSDLDDAYLMNPAVEMYHAQLLLLRVAEVPAERRLGEESYEAGGPTVGAEQNRAEAFL
jgi:hypothetical protein